MTPVNLLKKYFGYDSFRPIQREVVEKVLEKKDVIALMPTGSGKSVCFQVPAMAMEGTCLVISPLIALMKDQVDGLKANGVPAAFLNSSMSMSEEEDVIQKSLSGEIKLLYLSPEKTITAVNSFLSGINLSLIAIDEAHCVSQWGHDFRPEYSRLKILREKFPAVPVIALTATADKVTRKDIIKQLALNNPEIFISSFDRPNLSLKVKAGVSEKDKVKEILAFINKRNNESGIIYCLSRNGTEKLSAQLKQAGISSSYYHAGMSSAERSKVQEAFINDETPVICATIAFGMGIDKSNVRWVIHFNLPKNIEGYYQEIGRAGRDGLPSDTLLYYNLKDIILLNKFARESGQFELNLEKLKRMQQFSEAAICRRKILLTYFGESFSKNCGNCDVCHNPPEYIDGTVIAQKALSAITRLEEKTGTTMLIYVLRGSHNSQIIEKGYDKIKTYGAGKDLSYEAWSHYILQLLHLGMIEMAYDESFSLKVTAYGKMVLVGKTPVNLVNYEPKEKKQKQKTVKIHLAKENRDLSGNNLFEELRKLRKKIALSENLPPYIIFHDKTLHEMVVRLPGSKEEMLDVPGISEIKFEKYGKEFLQYINRNNEQLPSSHSIQIMEALTKEKIKENLNANNILDFFNPPLFNQLSEVSKEKLINAVRALPLLRPSNEIDNNYIIEQRKTYKRAYDHWSENERQILKSVLEYTNDLEFLSMALQRNPENIRNYYKKMKKEDVMNDL